jgi:hypothetical protein
LPAELELGDARYLLRDEAGEPEAIIVVRGPTVTVIDASPLRSEEALDRSPSKDEAIASLQQALEQHGELTGQPKLESLTAAQTSSWRVGYGEGPEVADGRGTTYPTT